jgi:hypothetical protein
MEIGVQWPSEVRQQGYAVGRDGDGDGALLSFDGMATTTSDLGRHKMVATAAERSTAGGFGARGCQGRQRQRASALVHGSVTHVPRCCPVPCAQPEGWRTGCIGWPETRHKFGPALSLIRSELGPCWSEPVIGSCLG